MWLFAPIQGIKRKMVKNNFGYPWLVDNSKSKQELKINYMPIEKTIVDFFQQMIDNDVFK